MWKEMDFVAAVKEWMVNDMRLGDLDALMNAYCEANECIQNHNGDCRLCFAKNVIDEQPTIDDVPVPCKIGDEVYGIRNYKGKAVVQKGFVGEMFFRKDMKLIIVVKFVCRGEWLEKVFPTYEAAEAARRKDGVDDGKN